jgi:DNA-binding response OmpR family regulator
MTLVGKLNPRILIADPDQDIRRSLEIYFKANGYEVQAVDTGGHIVKAARPWQPNVILISDGFTDANPYQVCQELMDDTLTGHIPLVMLLHKNDRRSRLDALESGVSDIVTKPFDIEELRLRIEAAFRLATMRVAA